MPTVRRKTRLIRRLVQLRRLVQPIALGLAGFYMVWNIAWIFSGHLPPSILTAITGIPCPTTGGTRSLVAALHGDWVQSFSWNPLTFVYLGLAVYSAAVLGLQFLRKERLVLGRAVARLWIISLMAGWVAKFAIGPRFW